MKSIIEKYNELTVKYTLIHNKLVKATSEQEAEDLEEQLESILSELDDMESSGSTYIRARVDEIMNEIKRTDLSFIEEYGEAKIEEFLSEWADEDIQDLNDMTIENIIKSLRELCSNSDILDEDDYVEPKNTPLEIIKELNKLIEERVTKVETRPELFSSDERKEIHHCHELSKQLLDYLTKY